ncbi:hypothetical protein PF002_g24090 [Phytophthora fragariae]|uniref:Peptidase A2 domain-containing protein n=1 Tax=Phytophthora fragariae TaxID=53985 RepID=A0A6A3WYB1_9STRA|nr:hypothetical protein PF002_g24090 [Phytophthora fragariae]
MTFELSLQDGALHWYRQLPRKTKRTWKLLSDAFIKYYCSKFTQSAKARYYSAKREDKEHVCDYLNRLNGYARNAGVQFENGGREAKDHVDYFLDKCDDRGLEERLCHARVKDIHDLEEMINDILRSRERKTAREPSVRRHRSQDDDRRRENRSNEEALADVVTALNIRASDGDYEDSQSAHGYGRDATEAAGQRDTSYDADEYSDAESDSSEVSADAHGHVDATNDNERRSAAAGTFARPDNRRQSGGSNQFQLDREGRRQYGPCAACNSPYHSVHYCNRRYKLCKQVHDAGKCDALRELTSLLRTKVDKKDLTPELQSLVFGGHLNYAARQLKLGKSKWPDDRKNNERVNTMENGSDRGLSLGENGIDETSDGEPAPTPTEAVITSMAQVESVDRTLGRAIKLLPGERMGWWSSQRYDKRKRMRALVKGAVDDARIRILLDTGANVSVISASFAKKLRAREVFDHGS